MGMSKKETCDILKLAGIALAGLAAFVAYLKTVEGCDC
jgi:hypothetical protein